MKACFLLTWMIVVVHLAMPFAQIYHVAETESDHTDREDFQPGRTLSHQLQNCWLRTNGQPPFSILFKMCSKLGQAVNAPPQIVHKDGRSKPSRHSICPGSSCHGSSSRRPLPGPLFETVDIDLRRTTRGGSSHISSQDCSTKQQDGGRLGRTH